MSPTEAITFVQSLAWMPEEYRGMAIELISGGNAADVLTGGANGGSNTDDLPVVRNNADYEALEPGQRYRTARGEIGERLPD